MSRCKACNIPFTDSDSLLTPEGFEEDLCSYCRFVSYNPNLLNVKEYQFEYITELPLHLELPTKSVDK